MIAFMTDGIKIVPGRVSKLRKKLYRSQQNLADVWQDTFGDAPHQTHVSGLERGTKGLSLERLRQLASLLDTNADYLLGASDDDAPSSDLEDQVVFSVRTDAERTALLSIGKNFLTLSEEDKKLVLDLMGRLSGKGPNIIS